MATVADAVAELERLYPPVLAESWDAVGLVCGDPSADVRRVYFCVDVVTATVDEAIGWAADLVVAHHPLLLRGVHGVPTTTYKGRLVHRLIKHDLAVQVAHTNADVADPGVSDALAERIGLDDLRPLVPLRDDPLESPGLRGAGRVGTLRSTLSLREFVELVAAALPATAAGIRASGDPDRPVRTVAVSGGAGDGYLGDAVRAGADAFVTADLRHHPASEHVEAAGPALVDAAHWATERPWLDQVAAKLSAALGPGSVATLVSDVVTDPWTLHTPQHPVAADDRGGRGGDPITS